MPESNSAAPAGSDAGPTAAAGTEAGPASADSPQPKAGEDARPTGHRQIIRWAGIVGLMTILSRITGLVRFRLMAHIFGGSAVADAFNFAFIFPNLTRRLFGEGLMTSAFVPVFASKLAREGKPAASRTASVLLCRLAYWLSLGCVALIALAGAARWALPSLLAAGTEAGATGKQQAEWLLFLQLFQWMLPYLVFINLAAVLMGTLNALEHFWVPAFAPVLLNLFLIGACALILLEVPLAGVLPEQQVWLLAYAVLIGGASQVLIQFPPALARGFKPSLCADAKDSGYAEVMDNFKPVVLLVAVFQLNVVIDNVIAKQFVAGDGPVTYLNMGTSVYQFVFAIVALAVGTAALPALSKLWAEQKREEFRASMLYWLRLVIWFALPLTVVIVLLSDDLVRLLYGSGKFLADDAEPVRRTAGVVRLSTLGLVFFSVNAMLARALYAMKDTRTPTVTSAWSVALNLALNLLFVAALPALIGALPAGALNSKFFGPVLVAAASLRESGIALASAISTGWQTIMLARALRKKLAPPADEEGKARGPAALPSSPGGEGKVKGPAQSELQTTPAPAIPNWQFIAALCAAVVLCAALGVYAYHKALERKNLEGFIAFFIGIGASLAPFWLLGRAYFVDALSARPHEQEADDLRYGVKEQYWSEDLKFQHSLYVAVLCSALTAFAAWAVQSSLPPEGRTWMLTLQRGVVPLAVSVFAYATVSGMFQAREYDEVKAAFQVRIGKEKK